MKLSLPLKLGILVVLLFSAVIATCLLWTPLRVKYYSGLLKSDKVEDRIEGVNKLTDIGEKGIEALKLSYPDGAEAAGLVLSAWPDVNGRYKDVVGFKPYLSKAASENWKNTVRLLVARGADVNIKDDRGSRTPLIYAIEAKNPEIARFLIEKGANVNPDRDGGAPPLLIAIKTRQIHLAELLIDKGADVTAGDAAGFRPLHNSAGQNNRSLTEVLLNKGADINAQVYTTGWTPFYIAVMTGHCEMAEYLIKKGADVNLKDKFGSTPLDDAIYKLNYELNSEAVDKAKVENRNKIIDLLRSHGGLTGEEIRKQENKGTRKK
ncbi:MAG: ankyrin repeat domain-containing protein [Planctomycetota bacterium]|jgi:hypothetical protein